MLRVLLTSATDRTLDVLELIMSNGQTQAAILACGFSISCSMVYQSLKVLECHGLVARLAEQHAYGIGLKTFELGLAYSCQHRVLQVAHLVLVRLTDETGKDGCLAVLHGNEIICVIKERAVHRSPLVSGVGMRLSSHLTITGRAVLSVFLRNQVRALYPNRQTLTDHIGIGPGSPRELKVMFVEAQRTGLTEEYEDVTPGSDSYTVAVCDYNDFPIVGLALASVNGSLYPEQKRSLKAKPRFASTKLSRCLGTVGSLTRESARSPCWVPSSRL